MVQAAFQFRLTQKRRLAGQTCFCEVSLLCALKLATGNFFLAQYRTQITPKLKEKLLNL